MKNILLPTHPTELRTRSTVTSATVTTDTASTTLVLPSWWVEAYLDSLSEEQTPDFCRALPFYDAGKISSLALILSFLQQQSVFLADQQGKKAWRVSVSCKKLARHLGLAPHDAQVRQLFFALPALRLLVPRQEYCETFAFFNEEKWSKGAEDDSQYDLTLAPGAFELIFGAYEILGDFFLGIREQICPSALLKFDCPPLAIWRSLWLDLSPVEQRLFLKMEVAMQWQNTLLHLDGIFGQSLSHLMQDTHKVGANPKEPRECFVDQLRIMQRLGKKLQNHGLIMPRTTSGFCAFGEDAANQPLKGPQLLWQASREKLLAQSAATHFEIFNHKYSQGLQWEKADDLLLLTSAGILDRSFEERFRSLWAQLVSQQEFSTSFVSIEGSAVVHVFHLILEWWARQQPGHRFPLEGVLLSHPLAQQVKFLDIGSKLPEALKMVSDTKGDHDLVGLWQSYPAALLCHKRNPERSAVMQMVKDGLTLRSARSRLPNSTELPAAKPARPGIPVQSPILPTAAETSAKSTAAVSQARLRQVALEELQRLLAKDPAGYQKLRQTYLTSLDEISRGILQDIQRRMQASLFEEQLKQRLVRYMIENPSSWRSPSQEFVM